MCLVFIECAELNWIDLFPIDSFFEYGYTADGGNSKNVVLSVTFNISRYHSKNFCQLPGWLPARGLTMFLSEINANAIS